MKIQKVTAKSVIIKDHRILFVKDRSGKWELPGGRIEFGERPDETLCRELKEELGLDEIEVGDVINVFDIQQIQDDGNEYQYIVIVFKCAADCSQVQLSDEHTEFVWLNASDIPTHPMKEGYKKLLES